jgi:hypothetical protein
MRDWSAIARLIRTKIETKKWDVRVVKNDLGHKEENTTEAYIRFAEKYYQKDPYDWLRAVLKFHKDSMRMLRLWGQKYGPSPKIPEILTNGKKRVIEVSVSPVGLSGPAGVQHFVLPSKISTNALKTRLSICLHYSLKSFFFSFSVYTKYAQSIYKKIDTLLYQICIKVITKWLPGNHYLLGSQCVPGIDTIILLSRRPFNV